MMGIRAVHRGGFYPINTPMAQQLPVGKRQKRIFKDVTDEIADWKYWNGFRCPWTDFYGDNQPDLMLVGEWMPITLFENQNGNFKNISEEVGFKNSDGWWNTVAQADFDQDGDMDYVAGNFGLNSQLKTSVEYPIGIFAKDYDKNGSVDPILSCYDEGKNYPVFSRRHSTTIDHP